MSDPTALRPMRRAGGLRPAAVSLQLVSTDAGLEVLAPEWAGLWQAVPDASPFLAPAWLLPWWRHLGGGPLRVVTARTGRRLVAVLPMFVWANAGVRRLLPLGISVSDRFDLLATPGDTDAVLSVLGPALLRGDGIGGRDWDRCELHELPQGSPLLWLDGPGLRPLVQKQSANPVLDLGHFARLGSRAAANRNLRRSWRRAAAMGQAGIQTVPEHEVGAAMEQLFALHTAQWQARGEPGVLAGAAIQRFHQAAAAGLARLGVLRLLRLVVNGAVVGVYYGFAHGSRAYAYAVGTDPGWAQIGPGRLLIGAAIQSAQQAGLRELDFLRGDEAYKFAWGAVDRPTLLVSLVPHAHDTDAFRPRQGGEQGSEAHQPARGLA